MKCTSIILSIILTFVVTTAVIMFVPGVRNSLLAFSTPQRPSSGAEASRAGHSEDESDPDALALSDQALKNIGIASASDLGLVSLRDFQRSFTFQAVIEERPTITLVKIPSPVEGIIQKIYFQPGQMIQKGQPLFDIQLTHEDIVTCQSQLLMLLQKKEIIDREIQRLEGLDDGMAPQAKRDIQFQKLENDTALHTQRSLLRLHGISDSLIKTTVEKERQIVTQITVFAPVIDEDCIVAKNGSEDEKECVHHHQLDEILIKKGQMVTMGMPLCVISDMDQLLIRGMAYAYNEPVLRQALESGASVTARFDESGLVGAPVRGLKIRNVNNRIDPVTRTLDFFVDLTNELENHDETAADQNPYLSWRFKPGQRGELAVDYQTIKQSIVVPVWAVARQQNNCSVFEWVGMDMGNKVFKRRSVHVIYQTKDEVVIANDGAILPGSTIALQGAAQLLVALDSGSGKLQSACPCGNH